MAVDRIERPQTSGRAHDDLVERLDAQVRERVRREGVDPQREALVVRRIAEDVVRDHDELSLTGAVAPVADDGAMVGELVARVSGFGPLQPFLDDPEVEEVWINDPSRVFIARRGRHELTNLRLDAAQVNELVERMLKSSGRRLDISTPFVDAMLPEGHRLHVVLEGITRGFTAVNIRKFLLRAHRLSDLVALGSLTPQAARFLEASVRAGLNILVAGGTQAGKTTMLNCLAAAVPGRRAGGQRRGGLRAAVQPPRLGGDADPAGRARADRRDRAARPGQGGAADAAQPHPGRRGPRGGVPRPAARAQLRPARDVHAPRQQRPRGAGEDVHPAAPRRRQHLGPLRACRRSRRRSTSWCTSASAPTAYAGSTRSCPCPAGWRPT